MGAFTENMGYKGMYTLGVAKTRASERASDKLPFRKMNGKREL